MPLKFVGEGFLLLLICCDVWTGEGVLFFGEIDTEEKVLLGGTKFIGESIGDDALFDFSCFFLSSIICDPFVL